MTLKIVHKYVTQLKLVDLVTSANSQHTHKTFSQSFRVIFHALFLACHLFVVAVVVLFCLWNGVRQPIVNFYLFWHKNIKCTVRD